MPYSDDEENFPSAFYYPGETNDPNATFQDEDNTEQNNNKNSQEKVFSTKSEQIALQQSHTINPLFVIYRTDLAPSSLGQYFPVQTEQTKLISP